MGVPFEFPVSDIIAGIGVIKAFIEAFSHTRGATKDHKLLSDAFGRGKKSYKRSRNTLS